MADDRKRGRVDCWRRRNVGFPGVRSPVGEGGHGHAGARGSQLELAQCFRTDVVSVDPASSAEERRELQRLAPGAGAGVQPFSAGRNFEGREHQLRAQVLDFDAAFLPRARFGHVNFGQNFNCGGQGRGLPPAPTGRVEFFEDAPWFLRLQTEPERRPAQLRGEFCAGEYFGAMGAEP